MTQCQRVISFIEENGSITSMDAYNKLGITRLASRINDLKKSGYNIIGTMEQGKNRFDEVVHYKRYSLSKEQE